MITVICTFKKSGRYYSYKNEFNNEQHKYNYIAKMERNGFKLIGIDYE